MKTIEEIIKDGESDTVEFKTTFNKEVIETLVAFANTDGGTVCLGVKDNGSLAGVDVAQESIQNWVNEIKSKTNPSVVPITQKESIQDRIVVTFSIQSYPIKPVSFQGKH